MMTPISKKPLLKQYYWRGFLHGGLYAGFVTGIMLGIYIAIHG